MTARTPLAQQPKEYRRKRLYLDKSTAEDFINAEKMDWIYFVGDITTDYELNFVHRFGEAMKSRPSPAPKHKIGGYDGKCECDVCKAAIEAARQARQQERERVLNLMGDYLAEHIYTCRGISCVDSMKMAGYIGSLRAAKPPERS